MVDNGVVTAFDESGELLFNAEYLYSTDDFTQGTMQAIIQVGESYVACVNPYPSKATQGVLRMIAVDSSGSITSRWVEKLEGFNGFDGICFVNIDGQPYAIVNGLAEHDPLPEDEDGNVIGYDNISYVTAIKRLSMP